MPNVAVSVCPSEVNVTSAPPPPEPEAQPDVPDVGTVYIVRLTSINLSHPSISLKSMLDFPTVWSKLGKFLIVSILGV